MRFKSKVAEFICHIRHVTFLAREKVLWSIPSNWKETNVGHNKREAGGETKHRFEF